MKDKTIIVPVLAILGIAADDLFISGGRLRPVTLTEVISASWAVTGLFNEGFSSDFPKPAERPAGRAATGAPENRCSSRMFVG